MTGLTYLQRLEAQSIDLIREAIAECERPAMLHSASDAGTVLLHLARKACYPLTPPLPLVHVHAGSESLELQGFDAVLDDAHRDGDGPPAKVQVYGGEASAQRQDTPPMPRARPDLWRLCNMRKDSGEHLRISPLSEWTASDLGDYLRREGIALSDLGATKEPAVDAQDTLRVVVCGSDEEGETALLTGVLSEAAQSDRSAALAASRRRLILDDASGRESCMRRLMAAASNADAVLILVDARHGMTEHTRRRLYLAARLGTAKVILGVDQLDLVDHAQDAFARIAAEYAAFAGRIGIADVACLPLSAHSGDNVAVRSGHMPWFEGPTLLDCLEAIEVDDPRRTGPLRMQVQSAESAVGVRIVAGRVVGGEVHPGDRVRALPSGKEGTVARIVSSDGGAGAAVAGQSTTVALADDMDISRGDMLVSANAPAGSADQFEATIVWLGSEPMLLGRSYLFKIGSRTVGASMSVTKYKVNVDTLEHLAAKALHQDDIGVCNLSLDQPVAFAPYAENRDAGSFILVSRLTNDTVGAGLLHFALRRSQNIHWQAIEVNKAAHAVIKQQRACIVWFTGLSGSGKSTIANLLEKKLHALGHHTYLLDGDNVRHGLNRDLGFTEADRVENIRRVAEVARLMVDAGLIVLVSLISPFAAERRMARSLVAASEFCEVFVDTPIEVAERRDAKGLYGKARRGELKNFTGIDSPYERPEHPEIRIDTTGVAPDDAAEAIVRYLREAGTLERP